MTEERSSKADDAYELSSEYRQRRHSPPKTIDGMHWRIQQFLEQQDRDWTEFLPDGTEIQFENNVFGEEVPVVPRRIRSGVLACGGMISGNVEEERTGWLGQSRMLEAHKGPVQGAERRKLRQKTLLGRMLGGCSGR